jgi:hypothetical protein
MSEYFRPSFADGSNKSDAHRYTFYQLALRLHQFGYLQHLDEMSHNIVLCQASGGIDSWRVDQVSEWVSRLQFLGSDASKVASVLSAEWVDGFTFMRLSEQQWTSFELSADTYFLLNLVKEGWLSTWGKPLNE